MIWMNTKWASGWLHPQRLPYLLSLSRFSRESSAIFVFLAPKFCNYTTRSSETTWLRACHFQADEFEILAQRYEERKSLYQWFVTNATRTRAELHRTVPGASSCHLNIALSFYFLLVVESCGETVSHHGDPGLKPTWNLSLAMWQILLSLLKCATRPTSQQVIITFSLSWNIMVFVVYTTQRRLVLYLISCQMLSLILRLKD